MDSKIFDTLLEPIFILDAQGKVLYCNEPAALMIDISVRKVIRSQPVFKEIILFADEIDCLKSIKDVTDASPYQEVHFKTPSGKTGRVQLTLQPFTADPSDPAAQWIMFFRDVTLEETLQRKYRAELEKKESVIRDLEDARAKLEDYSKNLEKMVAERTAQLSSLNQQLNALLDSLGQGFFIFGQDGKCFPIFSKACMTTVEKNPANLQIEQVLNLDEKGKTSFYRWTTTLFAEMLPFEDLAPLGPNRYNHSANKNIELTYFPLRKESGEMEGVVVVATDITELVASQKQTEKEKKFAQMILQLVQNKRQVLGFLKEADLLIKDLHHQLAQPEINFELTFRDLHTLKGGAASFSLMEVAEATHKAEDLLALWNTKKEMSVREELHKVAHQLPQLITDFVEKNQTLLGQKPGSLEILKEVKLSDLKGHLNFLPSGSPARTEFFEKFLLETVEHVFGHFNDQIRQVANVEGKIVHNLEIQNAQFLLWPEPYESLFASFIHAFRNSVDHGIENSGDRETVGKPSAGRIGIGAERQNDSLIFKIWDDGKGIDPEAIRAKLKKQGRIQEAQKNDHDVIQHVFDSEFSTREVVTATSGRGVGMDAILACAKALGGHAWVESQVGQGTQIYIQVPWIMDQKIQKAA